MKKLLLAAALALVPLAAAQAVPADVATAVSAPGRPADAVALDEVRKPAEVLRWLGLRRGDRVFDFLTGNGYYAEIMARAVGPTGHVTGWNTPSFMRNERIRAALNGIRERSPNTAFYASPNNAFALPEQAYDFIMLHLVYHDTYWESARFGIHRIDPSTIVAALFRATRPGGTVAVIDHVAAAGRDTRAEVEATHRILPATVRADFERAGFEFVAETDMLRNSADDRSKNVFDPSIRGRTDRFVYRFRRPLRSR
jgi:predicted methyltransferase